ncbi:MAG: peptidase MA family metallohydrolase [Chloroflexota bacterium]
MKVARIFFFLAICVGWWSTTAVSAHQLPPEAIRGNDAIVNFPHDISFQLDIDPAIAVQEAFLTYDVERFSCLEADTEVGVDLAEDNQLEWTWVMTRSGNPPPGTAVSWEWTIIDSDGNQFTTPRQTLRLEDERFAWRTLTNDRITLHWYEGLNVGPTLLDAAVSGLVRLEGEMGVALQDDVEIFIYEDSQAMREAVLYIQEWAGGVAFSEYNTILMGVPPNIAETWGTATIRHELAHLVLGQMGRSCVGGSRPTWLEEGLAVFAEGEPEQDLLDTIATGIEENSFEPVRSLNGAFSAHGPAAGIAYNQSYSVVAFLLETYGQDKMQALIEILAEGEDYDEALEAVYGFNVDGLELAWRASIGAEPRQIPPTPTPIVAQAVPTFVPLAPPQAVATPEGGTAVSPPRAEPSSRFPAICNFGLVPLLLLGAFWGARRKN